MASKLKPIPPGEVLLEDSLKPMDLSQNALARAINVPTGRINEIVRGKRSITADTAAGLSVYFGTTPDLWINLQARFDAKRAARELVPAVSKEVRRRTRAA